VKLESLLCTADGFGLTTASPWQRAVCRLVDAAPFGEHATPEVLATFGVASEGELPRSCPHELYVLGAVRIAKSMLAAAMAVRAT
jgi:hypothetical protein